MIEKRIDLSINFEYYKVFYVVAKHLNITKAGQELFISQPAVTQTINKLEKELGEKLFLRSNKGLQLTTFGKEVFNKVEKGVLSLAQIKLDAENFGGLKQGSLVIGAGTHLTKAVLSKPMAMFSKHFPNINIAIKDNKKEIMLQMLSAGHIDLFVSNNLFLDNEKFDFVPLFKDKRVFVASKEFLEQNKPHTFENFSKNKFIVISKGSSSAKELSDIAEKKQFTISPKLEVEGYSLIISMVARGLGVGFLPEFIVKEEIKKGDFVALDLGVTVPEIDYGIVVNKNYITKPAYVFLQTIEEDFLKKS